jgi:cold shock CspA family protein
MVMDQLIKCAECGTTFVWTTGEQEAGGQPGFCPMCQRLAKGYGFITPAEGADVFVHKSALAEDHPYPRAGQLVEFTVGHGPRGAQAEGLVVLEVDGSSAS